MRSVTLSTTTGLSSAEIRSDHRGTEGNPVTDFEETRCHQRPRELRDVARGNPFPRTAEGYTLAGLERWWVCEFGEVLVEQGA